MMAESSSLWTRNFILMTAANGLLFANFHSLVPTMAMYAASLGASGGEIGVITGIFAVSAIFVRFFTDELVRRWGRRLCFFGGLFCSVAATTGYVLFPEFHALLAARILHGFGFGLSTTFAAALAVEIVPPAHRGEGLGYFGLGNTVSMGTAPAVGVAVLTSVGAFALFGLSTAFIILSIVLFQACLRGCCPPERNVCSGKPHIPLRERVVEPGTGIAALYSVIFGFGFGSVNTYLPLTALELGIEGSGMFFVFGTAFTFLSRLIGGKLYDRRGPFFVILPGAVLYAAALYIVIEAQNLPVLLGASVFYGLGAGLLMPSLMTWIFTLVSAERRNGASATFYNMMDLGTCLGIVLLGILAGFTGYVKIFNIVFAVFVIFVMLIVATWYRKRNCRQE